MSFVSEMRRASEEKYTENGARALKSPSGACLNLFGTIGAMRTRSDQDIIDKWFDARAEDATLADNMVLYARDIRNGGCGERRVGRLLLHELAKIDPEKVSRNITKIVEAGRWDDLFVLFGTQAESAAVAVIKNQLKEDMLGAAQNMPISVLTKWLPSPNTSSAKTRAMAKALRKALGLTEPTYRKTLSKLRKHIKVVEGLMSANKWDEINFEGVPSLAMKRYTKAYTNRCGDRFTAYKEALQRGEAKVNASTLYPYDIIQPVLKYSYGDFSLDPIQEAQWKALPNYVEDENVLFVIDTSGSMTCDNCKPLATAVGLGIYFAQRNTGEYHNLYMSFSSDPTIHHINDNWNLSQCVRNVLKSDWGMSTDLNKAFKKIYDIAVRCGEVPKALCVVSDMEINQWTSYNVNGDDYARTITDKWKQAFEMAGLEMPKLIYWNVCARQDTFHAVETDNVAFVSGYGVGPFKSFQKLLTCSATETMREILMQKEFCWD